MVTKKFKHLITCAAAMLAMASMAFAPAGVNVMAESNTSYRPSETGSITLDYYESDENHPVVGSEWRIYKIGDIVNGVSTNDGGKHVTVNGLEIVPLAYQLKINSSTTAEDVEKCLNYDVISESEIKFGTNKSITDGKDLTYFDGKTDSKGRIVFSSIPQGVYIGMEKKAIRYHNRTVSFLVSVPGTDAQNTDKSSLDIHVEPKAVLSGDLTITKTVEYPIGNDSTNGFKINITLPEGTYRYDTTSGKSGYLTGKTSQLVIADKETVTIYDIPGGSSYKVEEDTESQTGYQVTYENNSGTIKSGAATAVKVDNLSEEGYKRYKQIQAKKKTKTLEDTDAGQMTVIAGGMFIAAAVLASVLAKKKGEAE